MTNTPDAAQVSGRFLDFSIRFFQLIKNSYQQQDQIKAGTQSFHILVLLSEPERTVSTMSELAAELGITKQHLTKLVNDLEEQNLVSRHHDPQNRRLVHLDITPSGLAILEHLKQDMLAFTIKGFSAYSTEELAELDDCLERFSSLIAKFRPQSPEEIPQ